MSRAAAIACCVGLLAIGAGGQANGQSIGEIAGEANGQNAGQTVGQTVGQAMAQIAPGQPGAAGSGIPTSPPDTRDISPWLRFDDPGPFEALLTWYPPLLIRNGIDLKDFIRSDEFAGYRRIAGDALAVDAIYVRAMSLTANNTAAALLIATVATFDHYVVGLRVPLLNLFFPLSNESYDDYAARVRNLPADFYADTPPGTHGDRDKLQHFFGSAFVALTFESRDAAARVGDFIEIGEDAAIVDGVLDSRDQRANWNGREFGYSLMSNNRRYPSQFLHTPVVGRFEAPEPPPDHPTHTVQR